jgi:hypothetical protein
MEHAAWTCIMDMLHRQEERLCSRIGSIDTQHGRAACFWSIDICRIDTEIYHRDGHAAYRHLICNRVIGMDMQRGHRHGHTARTWTCLVALCIERLVVLHSLFCGNFIALLNDKNTVLLFAMLLTDCRQICPDKLMICYLDTSANRQYLKKSERLSS